MRAGVSCPHHESGFHKAIVIEYGGISYKNNLRLKLEPQVLFLVVLVLSILQNILTSLDAKN